MTIPFLEKNKASYYTPPILITITVLLAHFRDSWFYVGAAISGAVILALFYRALRAGPPGIFRGGVLLPLLLLIGTYGTAAAEPILGTFFGILGAYLTFHLYRVFPDRVPRVVLETLTLYTVFLYSAFVWGLNYYFTPPPWLIMLLVIAGFFGVFRLSQNLLASWVETLVMAELSWVLLFWPVHFFTAAVVMLAAFYLMYTISDLRSSEKLSRRKIYFQAALISIVILVALLSSAWQPIDRI